MTVVAPAVDEVFTIRVLKRLASNPDRVFGNNYEVRGRVSPTFEQLLDAGNTLVNFEASFHLADVEFDRLVISTYAPDSIPYDPETFLALPLTQAGLVAVAGGPLPINICWHIARVTLSGRFGKLFYRRTLDETQVSAPAGRQVLSIPANPASVLAASITSSGVNEMFLTGEHPFELVLKGATGAVRSVTNLVSRGIALVPYDHAWYNRGASSPPAP